MTTWEVYTVTRDAKTPVAIEIERLHSTWETFDDAIRMAREMLGHTVRVRERFDDD